MVCWSRARNWQPEPCTQRSEAAVFASLYAAPAGLAEFWELKLPSSFCNKCGLRFAALGGFALALTSWRLVP